MFRCWDAIERTAAGSSSRSILADVLLSRSFLVGVERVQDVLEVCAFVVGWDVVMFAVESWC